ncbi:MAG: hypothetical protein GTO45_03170 [Candidatus Aminicenantes bacterium]|nr:hypothetical protein [Candidatus Aminicenantes bacterium]NIM77727.1 hypothetical protein [Candidatus Aminicenantes bacterium]NIN17040.1 hypothetical protein [Candidatus Aminicenantes bacterium]NIN40933.1 hypothetical protein [Candidatus Aminicenantes bacterium]NIN83738.1 hypothetical protein [Candidatus Aminicenantes bacterium]
MANVIEIDNDLYKALVESFGQEVLKEKINTFLISAIETQLEKYTGEILKFEKKYGTSFNEFEKMWDEGIIENKHSYEIEGDFMDWEMMEMEKKDLLTALSKLKEHRPERVIS